MFKGQTALITGSTSGIGLAIAEKFASGGANIILNGFGDAAAIENTRADLARRHQVTVRYADADMLVVDQIEQMIADADNEFGAIDILVNNAGIQHVSPVDEFPVDRWDAIIGINLSSAFHTIRCALPNMKKQGQGRIVNTASAHALVASPFKAAYVAAKHGLAGLTKTVALEVAEYGITVNAIAPGYVWTPLVEAQIPDTMKARGLTEQEVKNDVMLKAQPTKDFVTVEQVADFAAYLASPSAKNITGSVLSIDGGWTAQ